MGKFLKFFQILTLVSFFGLILLPFLNERFSFIKEAKSNENRYKAPKPDFDSLKLDPFVKAYDTYYTDNFNLRENMIKLLNQFEYSFYGVSAVPNEVLIGKEGWFFEKKSAPNYKGANLFTETEMTRLRDELRLRTSWAAERGIKYYVALVPNKMNVYPEFLPARMIKLGNNSRYDQIVSLDKYPEINVIDIRKNLLKHKNEGNFLYQHTDDHWNELGAYYGYQAIMERLNKDFPELGVTSVDDYKIDIEKKTGDLTRMINAEEDYPENFVHLLPKNQVFGHDGVKRGYPVPNGISDWDFEIIKVNDHGKRLKCLIIRDSFTLLLIKYLQEHFRESVFIHDEWKYRMREDLILKEKPDIVLNIILETEAHKLLEYPFTKGKQKDIYIQSATGKFLSVNENAIIKVDKDSSSSSETFEFVDLENSKCAFTSSKNLFVSADLSQDSKLIANRDKMNSWEQFTIVPLDNGFVAFKADNGKYLSLDPKTLMIFANSSETGQNEKFKLIPKEGK
jgi:hypothetical protein